MVAPTFSKKERIVSSKLMETLFEKGDSQAVTARQTARWCPSPSAHQRSQETFQACC